MHECKHVTAITASQTCSTQHSRQPLRLLLGAMHACKQAVPASYTQQSDNLTSMQHSQQPSTLLLLAAHARKQAVPAAHNQQPENPSSMQHSRQSLTLLWLAARSPTVTMPLGQFVQLLRRVPPTLYLLAGHTTPVCVVALMAWPGFTDAMRTPGRITADAG
jgi:hypothetical protein